MAHLRLAWTDRPPAAVAGGAVTVGNFDGVHRGHRTLIAAARARADSLGGPAVAVTFDPPPHQVLFPGSARPPLTALPDRAELLLATIAHRSTANLRGIRHCFRSLFQRRCYEPAGTAAAICAMLEGITAA